MTIWTGWLAAFAWGVLGMELGAGAAQVAPLALAVKRPMTFTDLMAMKRVSDPQISPSGKWVLFSVTAVSLEKNTKVNDLWVVPIGGGKERQLTFGQVNQTNGRFSPDGKWILLVSPGGGTSQIFTAKWDDATGTIQKPYPLTDVATEADGAVWSPDGKRILFTSSVYPECSGSLEKAATWAEEDACNKAKLEAEAKNPVKAQLFTGLLYRHWNAFTGARRSHVLVVDVADGEKIRDLTPRSAVGDAETPTFSLGGPLGYAWAPDSKEIAYVTNLDKVPAASTNNDVFTLRLDEAGAKAQKVSTSLGSDDGPQYSPDGRWLAFRSQERAGYEGDRFRLMVFERGAASRPGAAGEPTAAREVLSKFDGWVNEFAWAPDSKTIYFATGDGGEEPILKTTIAGPGAGEVGIAAKGGEFGDVRVSGDGKMLVASRMTVRSPATIIAVETGSAKDEVAALLHLNDAVLDQLELPEMKSFMFPGAGDTSVQGFIVRPPGFDAKKKYPVKFLIHGGPQGAWGDAWSYRWNPELMAASGYVVVMVNPRGSTGYGQRFIDGVNGDWGGKAYVDLMKGLDAAERQFPFIDKERECALGASYGGFMANWILTHPDPQRPDRFKCIVSHDGMYDPRGAYGSTEEVWFNEWEFRRPEDLKPGGKPAQPWRYEGVGMEEDPFRKWSPMLAVADAKTPTLVIHSQKDYRLDVSQGFELFTALQRLGVPSEMLYFPDEGHWVLKPKNSELWYKTVGDWCDRWTGTGAYAK